MSKRWLGLLLLVAWIGGSGVAHAALTATPDPVPIGTVVLGQSGSATTTLSASPSVTINSFDLGPAGCNEFTISTMTPLPLDVGNGGSNTKTVTVTLTPTSTGAKSCTITARDSANAVLGTFTATGTAVAVPAISVTPSTLTNFGSARVLNAAVTTTTTTKTFTISNTGPASSTLSISNITFSDPDYSVQPAPTFPITIASGSSQDITVQFDPSTASTHDATMTIASNAPTSPTNVSLTGVGTTAVIAVSDVNFGTVNDGATGSLNIAITNSGASPRGTLTVTSATITDTSGLFSFGTSQGCNGGTSCTFTQPFTVTNGTINAPVRCQPPAGATGKQTATVTFVSDSDAGGDTTAQLTCTAAHPNIDVSAMAIDFMNFRFDTKPTQVFHIINSGDADVTIQTQIFTPDTGTATTEFALTIKRGTSPVTLPQTLAPLQQLDVTVTAQPNNRIGLVSGHVDIHSDLAIMPDRRVTLTGNATTASIAFPAMVDFGLVDVDGPASNQTIMLTNNGMAILDVSSITKTAGASPSFSVTLPSGATQVAPSTTLALQVTYTPTVEQPPNQPDTMVLVANLAGIVGGPNQAMITVKGRGIDRHIVVDAMESFPPTFRNPGDSAPIKTITVHNNGEATLHIAGVMVTGAPVWELLDGSAIDLVGGGSHDFMVKFSPTMIGAAPTGQLTIVNNDNARPMAVVTLTGTGIGRSVAFGPPMIDLGYVVVGGRATTTDLLAVTNLDPGVAFTIHAIRLDDSVFHIEKAPADNVLPAMTARNFGITFEPTTEGHFETTARLYLDQDDQEQAEVMITGDAAGSIAVHGGGGCSTGGGAGSGAAIALAALVLRRRRRALAVAAISLAMLGGARSALADDVVVGVFDPTPTTSGTGFQLDTPEVGPAGSWVASGVMSYATDVLVFDTFNSSVQVSADHAIKQRTMFSLGGAYAFLDRFEAGLRLPVYSQHGDAPRASQPGPATYVTPATGTALGDLTIHGKARLVRAGAATFGAAVHVTLPTATAGQFTGVDGPSARVLGLAAWAPSARLSLSASAGGVLRKTSVYRDAASISQGSGFLWGTSASVRVLDRLWATAEVFGEVVRSGRTEVGMNTLALAPVEALAGATYRIRGVSFGAAVGRGITDGIGAPDLRGVMMLSYTTGAPELAPLHPRIPSAPDLDSDGDGIVDKLDRCPHEPEDKDGFQDDDGCPEPDNDHDGVADANDKCPNEAEDKDGFQDDDGCPDPDNDRDGIVDANDKCPNDPEDKDGFQDEDGCPDLDNDGDGIADANDKCPNDPETFNGKDDDDGCPDTVDAASVAAASTKAAEETFAQGRELLKQGKYAEACTAFEQSQRLDPQFGTQYNIAGCYEKTGKLATAWNLYRALARSDTNPTRRSKSASLATSLGRRVPKIRLVLRKKPEHVEVYLNGENANALIGVEAPVDFGSYGIVVSATGYRAWRQTVDITEERKVVTMVIDLEPVP